MVPTKPLPNRMAAGLVIAGAVMAVIGCFLPWISVTVPFFGTISRDAISGSDGEILAAVATISALIGVVMWVRRVGVIVPIVLFIAAAIAMTVVVVDYEDISHSVQSMNVQSVNLTLDVAEVGIGVFVTALGVVIWGIGSVAGLRQRND